MKKFLYIISLIGLSFALLSCNRSLEKDEVESKFDPAGELPIVSIETDPSKIEVYEYEKRIVVSGSFAGITSDMKNLQIGFMSATDYGFVNSKAVILKNAENGTFSASVPVVPGVDNYVVAMASTDDGAVYSRRLIVSVPDIPWYLKIAEDYVGDYVYGEKENEIYKSHKISMALSEDQTSLTIYNFDPYIAATMEKNEVEASKSRNYVTGKIDKEKRTVSLEVRGTVHYNEYVAIPLEFSDEGISIAGAFTLQFNEDATEVKICPYGIAENATTTQLNMIYEQGVVLKAN